MDKGDTGMKYLIITLVIIAAICLWFGMVHATPQPVGTTYLQPQFTLQQPVGTNYLQGQVLGTNYLNQ